MLFVSPVLAARAEPMTRGKGSAQSSHALQAVQWTLLEEQERVLAPLAAAFRAVDPASTGILSPTQCQRFCRLLHPSISPEEADLLLATLDCGTGQVNTGSPVRVPLTFVVDQSFSV